MKYSIPGTFTSATAAFTIGITVFLLRKLLIPKSKMVIDTKPTHEEPLLTNGHSTRESNNSTTNGNKKYRKDKGKEKCIQNENNNINASVHYNENGDDHETEHNIMNDLPNLVESPLNCSMDSQYKDDSTEESCLSPYENSNKNGHTTSEEQHQFDFTSSCSSLSPNELSCVSPTVENVDTCPEINKQEELVYSSTDLVDLEINNQQLPAMCTIQAIVFSPLNKEEDSGADSLEAGDLHSINKEEAMKADSIEAGDLGSINKEKTMKTDNLESVDLSSIHKQNAMKANSLEEVDLNSINKQEVMEADSLKAVCQSSNDKQEAIRDDSLEKVYLSSIIEQEAITIDRLQAVDLNLSYQSNEGACSLTTANATYTNLDGGVECTMAQPFTLGHDFKMPEDRMPTDDEYAEVHSEDFVYVTLRVPDVLFGKFLGTRGKFLRKVKAHTGIALDIDGVMDDGYKLCYLRGAHSSVSMALDMIEGLFPLDAFPEMIDPLNEVKLICVTPKNKVTVSFETEENEESRRMFPVKITGICSINDFYVQILDHPLYPLLKCLEQCLQAIYGKYQTKSVPFPCAIGSLCIGYVFDQWQRCEVLECRQSSVIVFLGDTGITVEIDPSMLRLPLKCVTDIPYFAARVFLNRVQVSCDSTAIAAGNAFLFNAANMDNLSALVVGQNYDQNPIISLFAHSKENSHATLLNLEMIKRNYGHHYDSNISCKVRGLDLPVPTS